MILSKTTISEGSGTKVELFVLDPTSTELVPSKALSTNDLKSLLQMIAPNIAYPVKSIGDNTIPQQTKSGGGNSKSKAPLIAGVILAILVLFAVAVLVFLYTHRQRQKR